MSGLLAKIARGVGGWMVQEAKAQQEMDLEAAKAQILFNRELALKQIDAQQEAARDERKHGYDMEEIGATGEQNRLTAVTQGIVKDRADQASDERDLKKAVTLKGIDLQNSKALEAYRNKLGMTKSAFDEELKRTTSQIEDRRQIDRIEYVNGSMVIYKKDGTAVTKVGVSPTPRAGASSDDLDALLDGGGATPSSARAAPQPTPAAPAAKPTGYKPGDTVRNKGGQVLQLGPDGKWHPYVGIAP